MCLEGVLQRADNSHQAISYKGLGPLHRVTGWMTAAAYADINQTVFVPYVLEGPFPDGLYHFQENGAPVHTTKAIQYLFESLRITNLQWPATSPDLNIIENVWGVMKTNLSRQPGLSNSDSDELWIASQREWERLRTDQSFVDALYDYLSRRIQSVKLAPEAQTRY
ncbi:hypothetical protein HPB48_010903 [Haemaphysalis longicornis]|uniref:Tc1-like transposase DDE domain-containing protein n=1 Tax=Haemaphysalis longicornis TaxID=44386 RepID=A0A9J6FYF5_HAELO|nr:hypothetical protein HPB48_010903 [Haemaphysalis longicornis]